MMRSKNFKIGSAEFDLLKALDLHEGVVSHLDRMKDMRDSLEYEKLGPRLQRVSKSKLELLK